MNDSARKSADGVYTSLRELIALRHGAQGINIFKPQLARSMLLGNVRSRFRGRGMELEEVRQYQPGDDVRMIDWRVTARTGRTHTKLFAEERERPVHIVVDQRSNMFFGSGRRFKSVIAAELTACIAWASLRASDRIGGQVFGDFDEVDIRAKRNRRAVMQLLAATERCNRVLPTDNTTDNEQSPRTITDILQSCRRLTRPGTAIFILSDLHDFDADAADLLSAIGRHTDIVLLQIRDPIESTLTPRGQLGFSDGLRVTSIDVTAALAERYRSAIEVADDTLRNACARAKAIRSLVSTDDEPLEFLARLFQN